MQGTSPFSRHARIALHLRPVTTSSLQRLLERPRQTTNDCTVPAPRRLACKRPIPTDPLRPTLNIHARPAKSFDSTLLRATRHSNRGLVGSWPLLRSLDSLYDGTPPFQGPSSASSVPPPAKPKPDPPKMPPVPLVASQEICILSKNNSPVIST